MLGLERLVTTCDYTIGSLLIRRGWLAVSTHGEVWAVPLSLDRPGRRLRLSFSFVAHADSASVWVDGLDREWGDGRYDADDHDGTVTDHLELGAGWSLVGAFDGGLVVEAPDGGIEVRTGTSRERTPLGLWTRVTRNHA